MKHDLKAERESGVTVATQGSAVPMDGSSGVRGICSYGRSCKRGLCFLWRGGEELIFS